ncbi:MAG: Gfo/Idh/MocA family oxidoreductase [Verrucomicrobiota bacterium]
MEASARYALIGVTGYGRTHLRLIESQIRAGKGGLQAATVINPSEAAEEVARLRRLGCRIYGDYAEMLERESGKIDLCLIPTGIAWHARMAAAALSSGCSALIEKPAAATVAEVEAMERVERQTGLFVAVGFQHFYHPAVRTLQRRIRRGDLGTVREIKIGCVWPRPRAYYRRNAWAGRLRCKDGWVLDSPVNNAMAHFLMLGLALAGASGDSGHVRAVEAELYRAQAIESFDTFSLRAELDGGGRIWFWGSHSAREALPPLIEIRGSKGSAVILPDERITLELDGRKETSAMDGKSSLNAMMRSVTARIFDPTKPVCTLAMAKEHTRIVNALHRHFPVHQLGTGDLLAHDLRGSETIIIPDINEMILRAFHGPRHLSQCGAAWGQASSAVSMDRREEPLIPTPPEEATLLRPNAKTQNNFGIPASI